MSDGISVVGVSAEELRPDPHEVLKRAIERFERVREVKRRQCDQRLRFADGPVGLVFVADQHIGNDGADYQRMFHEADLIRRCPRLYVVQVGDLVDNFIVSKLMKIRMGTHMAIDEEWELARLYLQRVGPRLVAVVGGNHEAWTGAAAGVDQLRDIVTGLRSGILYHPDELYLTVEIGSTCWPVRVRHKWRYSSILNPTHGIERSFERDQSRPFVLGVGAHTHVSGLCRQFNAGGRTGLAVQVGSYKIYDSFAGVLGLPAANGSTAMTVVFHPEHGMVGYDRLEAALDALS